MTTTFSHRFSFASIGSFFLALFCLLLSFNAISAAQPLPESQLIDFRTGQKLTTKDLQGKVLYLDFWASWCIPCKKSFPFMNKLVQRYDAKKFQIVAINMDEYREDAESFLKDIPANFPIYQNPEGVLASKLKVPGLPVAYIVDAKGDVIAKHIGFNDKKKAKKLQQLDYLLEQK